MKRVGRKLRGKEECSSYRVSGYLGLIFDIQPRGSDGRGLDGGGVLVMVGLRDKIDKQQYMYVYVYVYRY